MIVADFRDHFQILLNQKGLVVRKFFLNLDVLAVIRTFLDHFQILLKQKGLVVQKLNLNLHILVVRGKHFEVIFENFGIV